MSNIGMDSAREALPERLDRIIWGIVAALEGNKAIPGGTGGLGRSAALTQQWRRAKTQGMCEERVNMRVPVRKVISLHTPTCQGAKPDVSW